MSLPDCYTPEDSSRAVRKLSDGINEAIRANFGPMTSEEKRRHTVRDHQVLRESLAPQVPGDEIDELVGELLKIESDGKDGSA